MLLELVRREVEYYNQQDVNQLVGCHTDDIIGYTLGSEELRFKGKDQLRNVFEKLFEDNPQLKAEPVETMVSDPFVILKHKITGLVTAPEKEIVQILEYRGDLIARTWVTPY